MDFKAKVDQLCKERDAVETPDSEYISVNFRVTINMAALLKVFGAEFKKGSRHYFGGGLLEETGLGIFNNLSDEDAQNIAKEADIEATKMYKERGISIPGSSINLFHKDNEDDAFSVYWGNLSSRRGHPSEN